MSKFTCNRKEKERERNSGLNITDNSLYQQIKALIATMSRMSFQLTFFLLSS